MWLYIDRNTTVSCRSCGEGIQTGGVEVYLCAQSIETERQVIVCRCGNPFTFDDFVSNGARIVDRPVLRLQPAAELQQQRAA